MKGKRQRQGLAHLPAPSPPPTPTHSHHTHTKVKDARNARMGQGHPLRPRLTAAALAVCLELPPTRAQAAIGEALAHALELTSMVYAVAKVPGFKVRQAGRAKSGQTPPAKAPCPSAHTGDPSSPWQLLPSGSKSWPSLQRHLGPPTVLTHSCWQLWFPKPQ